jgi:hypothetical protein
MLVLAGVAALGTKAQAEVSTAFTIDIVITTDTFETSGGTVLFTTSGVGYSDPLSPGMAAQVAADSTLPLVVQSTASLIPELSDYDFLTVTPSGISDYVVLGGVGPASLGSTGDLFVDVADALVAVGGPGYSLITPLAGSAVLTWESVEIVSASEPEEIVGNIAVNVYDQNIIEQAPAAVPEPKTLALLGAGLLMLVIFGRRKASA